MHVEEHSEFLALPPEIRESIYRIILHPSANEVQGENEYNDYNYRDALVLFRINRQVYYEARKVYRDLNVFIRVETPWPEAHEHVALDGHVPILMHGEAATNFTGYSLSVKIDAPLMPMPDDTPRVFVILVEDLPKFTKTWQYADLSNPGLNSHLGLQMRLNDPYTPAWDEKRMPKWLQRKLIVPFGLVKGLRHIRFQGDLMPLSSVESEMRKEQDVPYPTPEQCLTEASRFKTEGNAALQAGEYQEALRFYSQAWEAMHIVVKGRQRHIHGEAFFSVQMEEGDWKGKHGQAERLTLRVQLVANTCLVYLKMENWQELRFWGMRTISMMRQAVLGPVEREVAPEMEAVLSFPSAVQVGKIYYRTAVAFKNLGDKSMARRLLRVAEVYLPNDEIVKKEIQDCALKLW